MRIRGEAVRSLRIVKILSLKYFLGTRGRNLLVIIGVALGVALYISIKTANISIIRSFEKSLDSVAGKAELSVFGNELGFPEDIYPFLVDYEKIATAAPVIWGTGHLEGEEGDILFIQGVDLLIDPRVRQYSLVTMEESPEDILREILNPGNILLTEKFAHRYGLKKGDRASFVVDDRVWELVVAGLLQSTGSGAFMGGNLAVVDISFAQLLFNKPGVLDRIDLILEKGALPAIVKKELNDVLPSYLSVDFSERRGKSVGKLLASFQLNLEVLNLIALFVGMFLLYNAVSYSVITRRKEIGILRAEGCSRLTILMVFLLETFLVSGLGSLLGIYLGIKFAGAAISLMSSTISSLYLITRVEDIEVPARLLILGMGGGIGASLLSAIFPAINAAFYPPILAITKGSYEIEKSGQTKSFIVLAFILFLLAAGVIYLPTTSPFPGYISSLLVMLGMSSLMLPLLTFLQKPLSKLFSRFGACSRLGTDSFFSHRGRNSVAIAALAVAVAMVVSIVIMVESFRSTIIVWLNQTLQTDIIVTMESRFQRGGTAKMSPDIAEKIKKLPQVLDVDPFRYINIEYDGHTAAYGVLDFSSIARHNTLPVKKGTAPFLKALENEGVVISEGFATIHNKNVGDTLLLPTFKGEVRFKIYGIYYDYAIQYGIILFDRGTFVRYWDDRFLSSLGIYVKEGKIEEARSEIMEIIKDKKGLVLFSNKDIKEMALDVFDQTFRITYALQVIAVIIAILGIIGSLASSVMARKREIGILRSEGLTRFQMVKLLVMESSLLGALGVAVGMVTGVILSALLIDVINYRSFGWTIQHTCPLVKILLSVLPIFAFTILAGIPPALKALSLNVSGVLRYE